MKYLKHLLLLLVTCFLFVGCTGSAHPNTSSALTVKRSATGTVVITAYPYLFDGYSHFSAFVNNWAFVFKDGQAGYRSSGGEYFPLYEAEESTILNLDVENQSLWTEVQWLAKMYPYFSDYDVAPYWDKTTGWTFSDSNGTSLIDEGYSTIADLWAAYSPEDSAEVFNHTAPSGAELFWPNPIGDGVYVLVNDAIRLYNQWGNEQPTRALARLVFESQNNTHTLTVIDQDGKTILQLASSHPDPFYSDSDLLLDGDWFYWRTDDGTVIPYQITVE